MPAVQTTYTTTMPVGQAGQPATMHGFDADTKVVETAAGIGFARAVSQGAAENGIIIGGTAAGFIGITYRDITLPPTLPAFNGYKQYDLAGVMVKGDIWVDVGEAVLVTDPVLFVLATGVFVKTVGAPNGAVPGARWIRGAQGIGQLALLRLERTE